MTDIIPTTNDVALGSGWGRLETYRGEVFRWVANDAIVYVATLKRVDHQVQIHIEPGPGVGLKPFQLHVFDGDAIAAELNVKGRQSVSVMLPAGEPTVHKLRLHTAEGGKAAPNDARILNFRILRIAVARQAAEVVPVGSGYKVGTGWYPLETFNGESFRWVNNDAMLEAGAAAIPELQLEVEPGPGFGMSPFVLQVFDQAGAPVGSFEVKQRQLIEIKLPSEVKLPTNLRLHVEGGGRMSSGDNRIMNFRILEYDYNREPLAAR
jgi:hypothetical protein